MKEIDWRVMLAIIGCITIIEVTALTMGHNGVLLSMVIMILAGLGGYQIKNMSKKAEIKVKV